MSYFVKIKNPKEFRRDILEASRLVIGGLQSSRSVLEVRDRKKVLLSSLRAQLQELELLMAKLDDLLPEKSLREEPLIEPLPMLPPEPVSRSNEEDAEQKKPIVRPPVDEEAQLQRALANIEKKLSSL